VIDKLDLRVKAETPFRVGFESVYRKLRPRARSTAYYKEFLDLRGHGIRAKLHLHCFFNANHKVELIGVGGMLFQQMKREAEKVFDCPAEDLAIMRLDLAADVPGVSVGWCYMHLRVRNKREFRLIGDPRGEGATLYLGNHLDRIVVYDKIAEIEKRCGRPGVEKVLEKEGWKFDNHQPSSGNPLVTRIERRIGASRIPPQLATFSDLESNAVHFDPFKNVHLLQGGKQTPARDDYSPSLYLKGLGLRECIQRDGLASTWAWINAGTHGNAGRLFRQLKDFVPPEPEGFQPPGLSTIYRRSVSRQLLDRIPSANGHCEKSCRVHGTGSEV
jgi:hypothetical protein